MDLSEYILEPLREDEGFTLYRGRHQHPNRSERSTILLMAPTSPDPAVSRLEQAEGRSSLGLDLRTASRLRVLSVAQYEGQAVLVLENPGDEVLDALVLNSIRTGHLLRLALNSALEEIRQLDDGLPAKNRVVRERVDQNGQLLHEQKWFTSEIERHVAERTLKLVETNEDLQLQAGLLQHLPVSAWTLKPDGTPDFVNQVWLEFSGQTLDFVRSHPEAWMTAVHPDDREKAARAFWEGVRSGRGFSFEIRSLRAQDGTYRWHLQQAVALRDAEGKILRFVGTTTDIHDQKLAEEALRASERNLRKIVDSIPGLVCTLDANGEVEQLNQTLVEYFGKTPEELRGWKMTDAVHPNDLPETIKAFTYSVTTGTPYDFEHRCRRADGVYRWFQVRALAVRDTDDKVCGWYVLLTDIEDRKQAEDELKRSEARYRVVIEAASDAVVSIDESGAIILVNPAAKRMFGYNPEELIGQNLTILMPAAMRELEAGFKRSLESGAKHLNWHGTEVKALRANGNEFPVEVSFGETTTNGRKVITGFIRDISEKKHTEELVRSSKRNLSLAINTIPALAWSARPDGSVEFLSQRWLDYTGMSAAEARGWGWVKAFLPDDLDRLITYWRSVLANGEPGEIEVRVRQFDGNYRWFLIRVSPLRDESGAIVKWYGINTDIDDRKRAEVQLTRARGELAHVARATSLGVLAASIAHEVNQPLSGIVMNARTCLRMLDSDPPNIDGARETARRTIRDGNRASEVVTRLRALFKTKEVAADWVNLNDAAQEVIALSLSELQSKRIIVRQEFAENLPSVKGDRIQLQQVIQNLLRNASDSMSSIDDRPRQLLIRTECDDSQNVQVTIQDTGIGIAPEAAGRLFDPFYTTKEDGTGIGLSVSRSIVEAHRGQIWAATNEGPGTSFIFSIPCDSGSLQSPG